MGAKEIILQPLSTNNTSVGLAQQKAFSDKAYSSREYAQSEVLTEHLLAKEVTTFVEGYKLHKMAVRVLSPSFSASAGHKCCR